MYEEESAAGLQKFILQHPVGLDDEKAPRFYEGIAQHFHFSKQRIVFIVVPHMVHTLPYFLQALTKIGGIVAIIPKASQYVVNVEESLDTAYKTFIRRDINKTILNTNPKRIHDFLREIAQTYADCGLMILDHGGYFAPRLDVIQAFSSRIVGIVEHTWNGQIRYEKELQKLPIKVPVFSIARSRLKAYEDDHVAASIINAMSANIFAGPGISQDLSRLKIGIIGYGHMGEAIAKRLLKTISPDKCASAERLFKHVVADKILLLPHCDVIIAAASAPILGRAEFNQMKKNACIICVTSRDDQFQADALDELKKVSATTFVATYARAAGDNIYLACDGKSVNFSIGSTSHPVLHAVLASVCVSAYQCATSEPPTPSNIIKELSALQYSDIEMVYEKTFGRIEHTVDTFGLQSSSCYFVGRKNEIDQLREVLKTHRVGIITQAIAGLGGMGKSTLASRYAKDTLKNGEYDLVARFDATNAKTLYEDFILFALHLGIREPQQKRPRELAGAVYDRLNSVAKLLIIFDNPDKYSTIQAAWIKDEEVDFLPPPRADQLVHCIVTTRNQRFQSNGVIKLAELKLEDACEYIQHYLPKISSSDSKDLATTLGCFPLALCQMVAYLLAHPEVSAKDYLTSYNGQPRIQAMLLKSDVLPEDRYQNTVYTTWNISFQALEKKNITSIILLNLFAYFDSTPIPAAILRQLKFTETTLANAIEQLRLYSLIEVNVKNQTFGFHDLVQTVSRLRQQELKDYAGLREAFTLAYNYGMSLPDISRFIDHGMKVIKRYDLQFPMELPREKIQFLMYIGSAQHYTLLFTREAVASYEFAVKICERSPAVKDLQIGIDLELAKALSTQEPMQYVEILDRMLQSDKLTLDKVLELLRQYGVEVDLDKAKTKILASGIMANFAKLPQFQSVTLMIMFMPSDQFFVMLLQSEVKKLWLPSAHIILASVGARDLAVAYLMFKNQLPEAEAMAKDYLEDTKQQNSGAKAEALCLLAEARIFQGKYQLPEDIHRLEEASKILENALGTKSFFYDQVHFLCSILYAVNHNFEKSHQIVFKLIDTLRGQHGDENIKRRIETSLKMMAQLEKYLDINLIATNQLQHIEQVKIFLAQAFRIAGRLLLTFKDRELARECLQKALIYDPDCQVTLYEYGLLLAKDRNTRLSSPGFFKRIDETQLAQPYSYFQREAEKVLPKFMRELMGLAKPVPLYFLACLLLAWIACREHRFSDCKSEIKKLHKHEKEPMFPAKSLQLLEQKLAKKETEEMQARDELRHLMGNP
jgi:hypothetical protein